MPIATLPPVAHCAALFCPSLRVCLEQTQWCRAAAVQVYTKKTGSKPDFSDPVVLTHDRGGISMEALCRQLHTSLIREFRYGLVWGRSAKHMP